VGVLFYSKVITSRYMQNYEIIPYFPNDITDIILPHIWYLVNLITQIYLGHCLMMIVCHY